METYIVRVNGTVFEVEVEKVTSDTAPTMSAAPAAPAAKPAAPKKAAGKGDPVVCGTAGKVFKVVAKEGDAVNSGDTVIILEAMKMEIPVVAPKDGTISSIVVKEGDSTTAGQAVAYIG
jgi:biotin carboxyl carrier protein